MPKITPIYLQAVAEDLQKLATDCNSCSPEKLGGILKQAPSSFLQTIHSAVSEILQCHHFLESTRGLKK